MIATSADHAVLDLFKGDLGHLWEKMIVAISVMMIFAVAPISTIMMPIFATIPMKIIA